MVLRRKHAFWFLALAAWNVFVWLTFAKNLSAAHAGGEDRPTAYWVVHAVLIVVNLVIAAALARFGWIVSRATDRRGSRDEHTQPGERDERAPDSSRR